jgi:ribosomal protein L11 methyltransferase
MVELTLLALASSAEAVSDALLEEAGALSVSVEDADAGTVAEQPLFGEPGLAVAEGAVWHRSLIKALFADPNGAERAAQRALAGGGGDAVRLQSIEPVAERDWVSLTQSQFTPTEIAAGFWVVPSWHEPPTEAAHVIRLDPGLAFGTGTHPTTRLCLRHLARRAARDGRLPARVLDYGCGSGILAIGAALHGALEIDAVDIDPQAVSAAAANATANAVPVRTGPPEAAQGSYGLILANILATPLKLLAPLLCSRLAPGGELVLAGILERQASEIASAYRPWLALESSDHEDGWVLMSGRLPMIGVA